MKRYILRLTYDFGDHPVRYLYVHKSGTWCRDTKEIDAATRFYNLGTAEKYEEKVRRNPHYEFYSTSILSFDDGEMHPCRYEDTESYQVTEMFINNREALTEHLLPKK